MARKYKSNKIEVGLLLQFENNYFDTSKHTLQVQVQEKLLKLTLRAGAFVCWNLELAQSSQTYCNLTAVIAELESEIAQST